MVFTFPGNYLNLTLLTMNTKIKADIYATANVWSFSELKGAAPVILMMTDVAVIPNRE